MKDISELTCSRDGATSNAFAEDAPLWEIVGDELVCPRCIQPSDVAL